VSTHAVPHSVRDGEHAQALFWQNLAAPHALPQAPQLLRSVVMSTHSAPQ
jgi:hypothetical protein